MREIIYPIEYLNIIANAVRRGLTKKTAKQLGIGGHVHHIIPKCVAPELEKEKYNIVFLTYEEHYIVHKLLAEANPKDKIAMAWSCMNTSKKTKQFFTAEDYANAMKLYNVIIRETTSGENSPNFGKKASDEARKKMSEAHKGKEPWNKGKSSAAKGKKMSDEQKVKISISNKGKTSKPMSDETKEKISNANKGHEYYGGGGCKGMKIFCIEHPDIIFKSQRQAIKDAKELGWTGVNLSRIGKCISGEINTCGTDNDGNLLHWRKLK